MITIPIWLLILLILLALGGISITVTKKEEKPKVVYVEPKQPRYIDTHTLYPEVQLPVMICIDDTKQTYVTLSQAKRMARAYLEQEPSVDHSPKEDFE